jgi:starch synthase
MSATLQKLAVCLLASEVAPLSKTGGLADVAGALAKYLHADGHDARLFTPLYSSIDRAALGARPVAGLTDVPLVLGSHRYEFSVLEATLPGAGVPVYLLDCPALYARASLYTADPDEHLRFIAFTRASLIACQHIGFRPQILHCNDWHTAFAPLYLRTGVGHEGVFAATRTVLTIHNIGYQGIFPAADVADLGLPSADNYLLHQADLAAGRINALRHGILYADAITTVSPTHASEICTPEYGMELDADLRARGAALTGILNGVDYDEWDPRRDRFLPVHYDPAPPDRSRGPTRRNREPPRGPEGDRAHVRGAAAGAGGAPAGARRARQRGGQVRAVLHRAGARFPRTGDVRGRLR